MSDVSRLRTDVRAYAELAARLRTVPADRATDVLEDAGVTPESWELTRAYWTSTIEQQLAQGIHELVLAYAQTFRATRQKLRDRPEPRGFRAATNASLPAAPAPPALSSTDQQATSLPSYLRSSSEVASASLSPTSAPPFTIAIADRQPGQPVGPIRRGPRVGEGTVEADLGALLAAAGVGPLPFDGNRPPLAPPGPPPMGPPATASGSPRHSRVGSGTVEANLSPLVAAASAEPLPFGEPRTAPAGPVGPARKNPLLAGTAVADLTAIAHAAHKGALPFAKSAEQPKQNANVAGAGASLPQDTTSTVVVQQEATVAAPAQRNLTLEAYAAITRALAAGQDRNAVLQRHNITADEFTRHASAWSVRLSAEPALLSSFKELVKRVP